MFVSSSSAPVERCHCNCPRIFPVVNPDHERDSALAEEETRLQSIPTEYTGEIGRKIFPIRQDPCLVMFRITRPHCRLLRNFIISNSSKLEMIGAAYCGIATNLYNINDQMVQPNASIGLLRFKTTDQAYRFVISESKLNRQEFLGGAFDVWNLSLCAEDRSVLPHPFNPDRLVSGMNVFHFVHVRKIASVTETFGEEKSREQMEAWKMAEEERREIDEAIQLVKQHGGRVIVATDKMHRIRGQPICGPTGSPKKFVYMTQWSGVQQFWLWLKSQDGRRFFTAVKHFTAGDFESLLFTCCLDFHSFV